ncbi:hypothetical protein [Rhodopseudomonas sp.]|uniref:hypothetical protein n=1 Tax=Rhodopseudomonas sp. TaxID=1078 RepID=UPI003B3A98F3
MIAPMGAGRDRAVGIVPMSKPLYIAMHAVVAAVFIFVLQRYALSATFESSLIWALTFGGCAAGLAYMQSNR